MAKRENNLKKTLDSAVRCSDWLCGPLLQKQAAPLLGNVPDWGLADHFFLISLQTETSLGLMYVNIICQIPP
ncbi:MAG: hypothetical protein Q7U34_01850 [Anaerolineales bacterium]|nr:hypothetical protein [Anaerolineales bacterium]